MMACCDFWAGLLGLLSVTHPLHFLCISSIELFARRVATSFNSHNIFSHQLQPLILLGGHVEVNTSP